MDQNKKNTNVKADRKIDLDDQAEIKRWCSEFQCNEMRLKNAIRAVGTSAEAVRQYMTKKF
jgi:hypothetical protein